MLILLVNHFIEFMNHLIFDPFEELLQEGKYESLKKEYIAEYLELYGSNGIKDIDNNKGIISLYDGDTYSFEFNFEIKLNKYYRLAKLEINKEVLEIVAKGIPPTEYIKTQINITSYLERKARDLYQDGHIIPKVLQALKEYIMEKYNPILNEGHTNDTTSKAPSFKWDYIENQEEGTVKAIERLYNFLLENDFIEGSKEDFINGFMGKPIINGIRWLTKAKDKQHTSKPSLFAFIDYLMEGYIIDSIEGKDYYDAIEYVFRDFKGNIFNRKSLRQSKSSSTAEIDPKIKDFINSIYSPTP